MNPQHEIYAYHSHHFGQHQRRQGEVRTVAVAMLTAIMMAVEVAAGIIFGSMALLADGLHMGSHAVALGIAVFAYVYTRKHAHDARFNFGTGKVNALGGFTGAILLALFAIAMAWESFKRFFAPVPIAFNQAILVAVTGLLVNGLSVLILGNGHDNHSGHDEHDHHHDHNLRSAYLHVLADALTSLFAIGALVTGKYLGWTWMDPTMGIVGAVVIAVWSRGLLLSTARVLLDMKVPEETQRIIRESLEQNTEDKVTDLHVWSIGPNLYAAAISITSSSPKSVQIYRQMLPAELGLVHVTIEVN